MHNLFFELIRFSIGTQSSLSRMPSAKEWEQLYAMAQKQSLIGICFAGVKKLCNFEEEYYAGMNEMLYLTWMGMAAKIQQRNEVVNRQCVELQQMIERNGFRNFIMKGQGNAALYADHLNLLRQSGDIDIYLEGGFEKVNAFVQRTCPTKEINELEIHYHCFDDTEVEVHYRPFIMRSPIKNARLQRFFNEAMRYDHKVELPNGTGSINVPTMAFNIVHLLVHVYHHLFTEGIGMRQLMDYFFVVRTTSDTEVRVCREMVSELGLERFGSALMWVLGHVFGMAENKMLWSPNEKDGRMLLDEVLLSGNFGKLDERQKGLYDSKWNSFWMVNGKSFRLARFDRWMWFWSPLWRIYHFVWRKAKGFA